MKRYVLLSITIFILFYAPPIFGQFVSSPCLDHHEKVDRIDIFKIEWPDYYEVLTNWGTKPEWVDSTHFVFISNQVGDVYLMDILSKNITKLTGHFKHAGFTRAHKLKNGDLLLLGPKEGKQPPKEPLVHYNIGQFTGELFILKTPYDGLPIPLGVAAWEGIAVSRESNRIAWSDSNVPFFGDNIFETAGFYFNKHSNVWTGIIEYDTNGIPRITKKVKLLDKEQVGSVLFEPQNFHGKHDEGLLVSAYGPFENLSGLLFLNTITKTFRRINDRFFYQEWEGIHPSYTVSFVELNKCRFPQFGIDFVELYLYYFNEDKFEQIGFFKRDYNKRVFVHEPVFSKNGKFALMTTASSTDSSETSPGYGIGIVLFNYEEFRRNNP